MTIKNLWVFDESKLLILYHIHKTKGDVCGKDLVNALDMPKNLVSYHIRDLRENYFIKEEKDGKFKFYTIDKRKKKKVQTILKAVEMIK